MKRYIRSDDRLPQLYQYSVYRLQIGDEIIVNEIDGETYNFRGIIFDIRDDMVYMVPKTLYVEGKKDYPYSSVFDFWLDADGIDIDLVSTNYNGRQITHSPWNTQELRNGDLDDNEEDDV